jgi:hypothetical protein
MRSGSLPVYDGPFDHSRTCSRRRLMNSPRHARPLMHELSIQHHSRMRLEASPKQDVQRHLSVVYDFCGCIRSLALKYFLA